MSFAQPSPLRRPPSATTSSNVDVIANIQHANARLAARSRSRDGEQQRRGHHDAPSSVAVASPNPPRPTSPPKVNDHLQRPHPSTSTREESVTTAAPSFSAASASLSVSSPSTYVDMSPPDTKPTAAHRSRVHESVEEELARTRHQLEEVQRLYDYEKRAHLQQRARRLREEAQQREAQDDIVVQTAQLLTDYEALIHFRDAASAEHLEAAMQRISHEWQRCAAELEKTRDDCATSLLSRLQASCAAHQETLKKALQQHLVTTAQSSGEAEAQQFKRIAAAVQDQVESFRKEYRSIVEQDMEERQRLMDAQAARREQQWLQFLKEEHARMIAAGEASSRESTRRQLETLHIAMRDITELRENLLKERAQWQLEIGRDYLDSYERLAEEYAVAAQETAEYVQRLQQEYAEIIKQLHREVNLVMAKKQAAEHDAQQTEIRVQEVMAEQQRVAEAQMEARWQKKLAEERDSHRAALAQLTLRHDELLRDLQTSYEAKESARVRQYEAEIVTLREKFVQQHAERSARAEVTFDGLRNEVRRLEDEKDSLVKEVLLLKKQLYEEQCSHEVAVQEVRQEQEAHFATQLHDLDTQYETALQKFKERMSSTTAAKEGGKKAKSNPGAAASAHAVQRVAELEEELQHVQHQHTLALCQVVEETTSLWSSRLKAAQQRQMEERDALEAQHRRLRETLLEEVREREDAVEARCTALREAHQQELQEAIQTEMERRKRAVERWKREYEDMKAQIEAEVEADLKLREEVLAEREKKLAGAEAAWQRKREDERDELLQTLKQHVTEQYAEQQNLLEEREARLREEQDAFAYQKLRRTQELRISLQHEANATYAAQLHDAQQEWMRLVEEETRQRYTSWQEARKAELEALRAHYRSEMDLLRGCYEAQLQSLRQHYEQHAEDFREEMRARETAWAAARAASLDSYESAAADRLQEVLAHDAREWEAAWQHRTAAAKASLESVAERAAEVLAATEADRCRMEEELREVYVTVIQDQERKTADYLTALHARHQEDLAKLRLEGEERLQRQSKQLREEAKKQSKQQEDYLKKVLASHEEETAALRAEHAKKLAEQRNAAQEALLQAHQQASEAQRTHEALIETTRQETEEAHRRQLHDLQKRYDAQTAQLIRCQADMQAQSQLIREEQQAALRQEYEGSMTSLREALEARNQSYASLQTSLYEQVQAEAARLQAKMEKAYLDFTEEQRRQTADRLAAQETAQLEQQRRHEAHLARLQQQHEAMLTAQAKNLRAAHDGDCAELKAVFDAQQTEWKQLLEAERAEREMMEKTVKSLNCQLAQLQLTQEQQQAAAYRALDDEYHHLLDQAMAQLQAEREEAARQSLEAAEQRFMAELLPIVHQQNEEQQQRQKHSMPSTTFNAQSPQQLSFGASTSNHARPTINRARALYRSRGVMTPTTTHAPHAFTSPLSISPAGPVELVDAPTLIPSYSPFQQTPSELLLSSSQQQKQQEEAQDETRLEQLWDVLEVPLDERYAFLDYVHTLAELPPEQRQHAWRAERQRLEAQLPLLEALTRRDYVERQLRTLRKASSQPLSSVAVNKSAGRKQQEENKSKKGQIEADDQSNAASRVSSSTAESPQVYDRLAEELTRLTEQLRQDVTAHETRYGQLFRYNGRRVMEMLDT